MADTAYSREVLALSGRPNLIPVHHRAIVPVYLDGKGPFHLEVDTGADVTFVSSDLVHLPASAYSASTSGIGGELPVAHTIIKKLRVGKFIISDVNVAVGNWRSESLEQGKIFGLLGQNVLSDFKVTFDYPKMLLILEYNPH